MKENALYVVRKELDIPDDADSGVLEDEEIDLSYGEKKELKYRASHVAYWDTTNKQLFEFITNNFEPTMEK